MPANWPTKSDVYRSVYQHGHHHSIPFHHPHKSFTTTTKTPTTIQSVISDVFESTSAIVDEMVGSSRNESDLGINVDTSTSASTNIIFSDTSFISETVTPSINNTFVSINNQSGRDIINVTISNSTGRDGMIFMNDTFINNNASGMETILGDVNRNEVILDETTQFGLDNIIPVLNETVSSVGDTSTEVSLIEGSGMETVLPEETFPDVVTTVKNSFDWDVEESTEHFHKHHHQGAEAHSDTVFYVVIGLLLGILLIILIAYIFLKLKKKHLHKTVDISNCEQQIVNSDQEIIDAYAYKC